MLIREWSNLLEDKQDHLTSISLWVNLDLPKELWSVEGIVFSASLFGVPLVMDEYIKKMSKMKFVRVYLEVKIEFKFTESILVDLKTRIDVVKVVYKWKLNSGGKCQRFGINSSNFLDNQDQPAHRIYTIPLLRQWQLVPGHTNLVASVNGGTSLVANVEQVKQQAK